MTPSSSVTPARPRPDVATSHHAGHAGHAGAPDAGCAAAIAQLDACLGQLDDLVGRLEPEGYALPLEGIFGGSVGGHVRHCLDHVRVLAETIEAADDRQRGVHGGAAADSGDPAGGAGPADYDTRARGTDVESDPAAARVQLDDLRSRLAAAARVTADHPVALSVMMSGDGLRIPMQSTVAREVAFVFSHTIHHQAMIAGMARHLGVDVPAGFGRAPSTIAHDESRACAR